jgi:hypothetical protein
MSGEETAKVVEQMADLSPEMVKDVRTAIGD